MLNDAWEEYLFLFYLYRNFEIQEKKETLIRASIRSDSPDFNW